MSSENVKQTLVVFVPFDLGQPLQLPRHSERSKKVKSVLDARVAAVAGDSAVVAAFGRERIVTVRLEAVDYVDMKDSENYSFPYGTNALLGPSLRLYATSGTLLDAWRRDAISITSSPSVTDFKNAQRGAAALAGCADWQISIDAFECGVACLRLCIELGPEAIADGASCASLLEYAIYGDINQNTAPSVKIDTANRILRGVRNTLVRCLYDQRASKALNREDGMLRRRSVGMPLRWTSNLVTLSYDSSLPPALSKALETREEQAAQSLIILQKSDLRYHDHSWMAVAYVDYPDTFYRLLYNLTTSEVVALLSIDLAQDLDERLGKAMGAGGETSSTLRELREIRLFTQIARGLANTWRISAYDGDIAIADSRARHYNLERYREHLASAAETFYALESAGLAEQQRRRADAIALWALIVALVTTWSLVIALKDADDVWSKIRPHLRVFPVDSAGYILDSVILTPIFALLIMILIFKGRPRMQGTSRTKNRTD